MCVAIIMGDPVYVTQSQKATKLESMKLIFCMPNDEIGVLMW